MDQDINNSQNEFLWALLANPASDVRLYTYNLQRLVNDFPQSGILHALLAHASEEKNLRQASVYFNARSLYKLINAPSTFTGVPDDKIIIQTSISTNGHYQHDKHLQTGENLFAQPGENIDDTVVDSFVDDHLVVETEPEAVTGLDDHQPAIADEEDLAPGNPLVDEYHTTEAVPEIAESTAIEEPEENIVNETHDAVPAGVVPAPQEPGLIHDAVAGHGETEEVVEDKAADIDEVVSQETIPSHEEPELVHHAVAENIEPEEAFENKDAEVHEAVSQKTTSSDEEPELIHHAVAEHIEPEEAVENKIAETYEAAPQEAAPSYHEPGLTHHIITEKEEQDEPVDNSPGAETEAFERSGAIENSELEPEKNINEETFDEIVGIEHINTTPETDNAAAANEETETADEKPEPAIGADNELEELVPESIASTDFFMFDKAFGQHKLTEEAGEYTAGFFEKTAEITGADTADHQDVSKYNDEKMPYTFMWWLDKTRKEHAGAYQPYVKSEAVNLSRPSKRAADELQQQYFENIFHITSVDELDKNAPPLTAPYNMKRKEHVIIERFIKEEPQIKPQSSDKIDNENKAKKSSEDRDELVTETLAIIYTDQMLYHKAIASYKKLMLKFPEKSRYFADKIEQLEKKTN